jgi:hypothetical protein
MSAEDIEEQAVDPEDKETLTEIMEQNLVLKVLEKELKQQESISQKIYETLNQRVYKATKRPAAVTANAKPKIPKMPEAMLNRNPSSANDNSQVTKFPSIKRVRGPEYNTHRQSYKSFA